MSLITPLLIKSCLFSLWWHTLLIVMITNGKGNDDKRGMLIKLKNGLPSVFKCENSESHSFKRHAAKTNKANKKK